MVICLERDLHMAQLMPLPLTVSCFSKIRIGFTFRVVPDKGPLNVCVCVAAVVTGLLDYGETTGRTKGSGPRATLVVCPLSTMSSWLVCVITEQFQRCSRLFYRAMLCIRGTSHGPVSICLSVFSSVTSRSSTKTVKRRITQATPHDSPGTLVF